MGWVPVLEGEMDFNCRMPLEKIPASKKGRQVFLLFCIEI